MHPAASVSGFYLAHPQAQYFNVGRVGEDQVQDMAERSVVGCRWRNCGAGWGRICEAGLRVIAWLGLYVRNWPLALIGSALEAMSVIAILSFLHWYGCSGTVS